MITVEQKDGEWIASCSDCEWERTQGNTKLLHICPTTGQKVFYTPPDWDQRSDAEKNPWRHKDKIPPQITVAPRRKIDAQESEPLHIVVKEEPSLARKAVNFTKAAAKHIAAGRPKATDEQVAERFEICQACPLFKFISEGQGVCTHKSCGCNLKTVGIRGKNKLRWADSVCPDNPPRWLAIEKN